MAYIPTTWINNQAPAVNEINLNKIESGIADAHSVIDNNIVSVDQFGALFTADDAATFNDAATFCRANNKALHIGKGDYNIGSTLDFSDLVVYSHGAILNSIFDGVVVSIVAASAALIQNQRILGHLTVKWAVEDFSKDRVGFLVQNSYAGEFNISWDKATIGLKLIGDEKGCVYNRFNFGVCHNHNVGIYLTTATSLGWCNANIFYGGRFFGLYDMTGSLYESIAGHIYIDDSLYAINGNDFVRMSLEWNGAGFRLARMAGLRNLLKPMYCEIDSGDTTWIIDAGTSNTIDCDATPYLIGYDPTLTGVENRVDASTATTPTIIGAQGYRDSGAVGTQYIKNNNASRPTLFAEQGNPLAPAIVGKNASTGGGPALQLLNPDESVGVEMTASGGEWTIMRTASGTVNKKIIWNISSPPTTGDYHAGDIAYSNDAVTLGYIGWYCTTDIEPHVWRAWGQIGP